MCVLLSEAVFFPPKAELSLCQRAEGRVKPVAGYHQGGKQDNKVNAKGYVWRVENFNHNRNSLMTAPVPVWCIYTAKLCSIFRVTLLTQVWMGILYIFSGKIIGLPGFPDVIILYWLLRGAFSAVFHGIPSAVLYIGNPVAFLQGCKRLKSV